MSLEKNIHQQEFRSEYQKAVLNILYTYSYLVGKTNDLFKDFEITRQQYNVLRILRGQHPMSASISMVRERMLDKMSDASRIVERLRIKGLVIRQECEKDRRSVEVAITPKGLRLLEKMQSKVDGLESLMYTLSETEAETLNKLLDKITTEKIRATKEKLVV